MLLTFARLATLWALLCSQAVFAQRDTTRDALLRLEDSLSIRREDGVLGKDLLPAIVVSVTPAYEESKKWFPTAALKTLVHVFGAAGLRSCEACMAPRLYIEDGRLEQNTTDLTTAEISRLDETARGKSAASRTAIWLDETAEGVSLRIIDLQNSRIVFAENFDRNLSESASTRRTVVEARELDRRARGDALTHTFIDVAIYPGQHVSLDWSEQWGDTNRNLSGVSLSIFDPVVGFGGEYFRVIPELYNLMVGAKLLLSIPTALVSAVSGRNNQVIDPIVTGVFMARLPIASSNYGIIFSASTNGRFGLGFSLMNFSLLPFLP